MVGTGIPPVPSEVFLLVVGYFVSGLLSLGVSFSALRKRTDSPTVGSFGVLLLFTSIWCFGFMARTLSRSVEYKLTWLLVGYVGLVSFPTSLVVFSLYYSGKGGWVTRHTVGLLAVVPAFFILALSTNAIHGSFFTSPSVSSETGWGLLAVEPEPIYWVNVIYNYLLYLFSLSLLAIRALRSRGKFRRQATLVLVAFFLLWLVNLGFTLGLEPFPEADPTPIAIGVSASILIFAVARADLIDIVPVAREQVLESVEDGFLTVDREGRIVDVNTRGEKLLGIDGDGAIGEKAKDLLPNQVTETGILGETDVTDEDVPGAQAEVRLGTEEAEKDHDGRWLWVRRFPLSGALPSDRKARGWILILTDITRRKRREKQLARQNERLDRIAGVVSHDLRNPMDVIRKRGTLARETGAKEDFEAIDRSVERMDELLEDMLQLARQGRDIDERRDVEIDSVAESAWHTVDTKDAQLTTKTRLVVSADKSRLRQAFENLFRNSLEHAGEGVKVTVGVLPETGDRERNGHGEPTGFYIEDDGDGIPPDSRDEVFEYGWTSADGGNGFGLAIVRDIIEAHGWRIRVTEGEHGGARFEVSDIEAVCDTTSDAY